MLDVDNNIGLRRNHVFVWAKNAAMERGWYSSRRRGSGGGAVGDNVEDEMKRTWLRKAFYRRRENVVKAWKKSACGQKKKACDRFAYGRKTIWTGSISACGAQSRVAHVGSAAFQRRVDAL